MPISERVDAQVFALSRMAHRPRTGLKSQQRFQLCKGKLAVCSWKVLSQEPSGDRIARSCRHTVSDLAVKAGDERWDRKNLFSQYVFGFWSPFKP